MIDTSEKKENFFDAISYFEYEQNKMLEDISRLEEVSWEYEKIDWTPIIIEQIKELNKRINEEFIKYYTLLEDILFPELNKVLPTPTSTTSMKTEHTAIMQLNQLISNKLNDRDNLKNNKAMIITNIITLVDILQRHFHKKSNVMFHEVSSFLSEETLNNIYSQIKMKAGNIQTN